MGAPRDEFDRLLASPSLIESELAQQLLREDLARHVGVDRGRRREQELEFVAG